MNLRVPPYAGLRRHDSNVQDAAVTPEVSSVDSHWFKILISYIICDKSGKNTMISLSKEETAARFGVEKAIEHFPSNLTAEEEKYVKTVLQYMDVGTIRSDYCFHSIISEHFWATTTT